MFKHAFCLLSAFLAGSCVTAATAQTFVPVSLNAVVNRRLQNTHPAYPFGNPVILGDVPFNIAPTGNNVWDANTVAGNAAGTVTLSLPINRSGVTGVHTLINTLWGETGAGTFLSLRFTFSDATALTRALDGNVDVRDYYSNVFTNNINGTTAIVVFRTDVDGPAGLNRYRLDKQFFDLSAFSGKTLTSITLTDTGHSGFQRAFLSGVTLVMANTSISGRITLQGAIVQAQPVTFEFRPTDGSPSFQRVVTLNADCTYSVSDVPRKPYTLRVKGERWLARTRPVDTTNGSVSNVDFMNEDELKAGDANNDNFVDALDLAELITVFNSEEGDGSYNPMTDFNTDGFVDAFDLGLLIENFNTEGEP